MAQKDRKEQWQSVKDTTEKLWDSTRRAMGSAAETATFQAGRYRKVVGSRIDIVGVEHRLRDLQTKLGRTIHEALMASAQLDEVVGREEVSEMLGEMDELVRQMEQLREEIAAARAQQRPEAMDEERVVDVDAAWMMAMEEDQARESEEEELHL